MRAFHDIDKPTCRDRLQDQRCRLRFPVKAKRFARFYDGRVHHCTHSTHRSRPARLWRTILRIKRLLHPYKGAL